MKKPSRCGICGYKTGDMRLNDGRIIHFGPATNEGELDAKYGAENILHICITCSADMGAMCGCAQCKKCEQALRTAWKERGETHLFGRESILSK